MKFSRYKYAHTHTQTLKIRQCQVLGEFYITPLLEEGKKSFKMIAILNLLN